VDLRLNKEQNDLIPQQEWEKNMGYLVCKQCGKGIKKTPHIVHHYQHYQTDKHCFCTNACVDAWLDIQEEKSPEWAVGLNEKLQQIIDLLQPQNLQWEKGDSHHYIDSEVIEKFIIARQKASPCKHASKCQWLTCSISQDWAEKKCDFYKAIEQHSLSGSQGSYRRMGREKIA
jgi:hypothetical protein